MRLLGRPVEWTKAVPAKMWPPADSILNCMPERSGLDDPELRDFGTLDRARKAVALSGEAVRKRAIH